MASTRSALASAVFQNIGRQYRRTLPLHTNSPRSAVTLAQRSQPCRSIPRYQAFSVSSFRSSFRVYHFDEVKKMSESPTPDRILIDVREPSEVQDGHIPSAINVPVKSHPDAWHLPEEEFEDRFGFSKPHPDKEVVFYCRSGVRSNAAAQLAQQNGYQNISEYKGSWLDWQEKGGPASKP